MQLRVGVIGIPGVWSSERLADIVGKKTGFRMLVSAEELSLDLKSQDTFYRDVDLMSLDGMVIKKVGTRYSHHLIDRIEILKFLVHKGLRIFSNPHAIAKAVDRLSCTLELVKGEIPMPETVITEDVDSAMEAVKRFGKAVFKPLFSSKARGMEVIEVGNSALDKIRSFNESNPVMYVQKMVDFQKRDLGLAFLGGEYLGTYARVGKEDSWNTTTHFGGRYESYEPSEEIIELAHKAQSLFQLDFTCVDVAETKEGPVIFEVSAFGGYRGLMETHGIDAAELYADYVLKKISNGS
jgi:ribosomal protein S6--L-glutamate ligase